jgi:putative ABC transport system ATP-binding protein
MIHLTHVTMSLTAAGRTVRILDDISLDIPDKQRLAIVGPSGSGKSTLLGLIAGLDRPTSGAIVLDGVDITALPERELTRLRRDRIGYIFQSFHLIPTLTAAENVAVPLELTGAPDPQARARALLGRVGLADRADHYPVQLSGGEQQRVAVARAFAAHPALLLADEPTGNLDSATGTQVIDLLFALNRDHGSTLILVTHDPEIARAADRIVTLRDGRIERDTERSV